MPTFYYSSLVLPANKSMFKIKFFKKKRCFVTKMLYIWMNIHKYCLRIYRTYFLVKLQLVLNCRCLRHLFFTTELVFRLLQFRSNIYIQVLISFMSKFSILMSWFSFLFGLLPEHSLMISHLKLNVHIWNEQIGINNWDHSKPGHC